MILQKSMLRLRISQVVSMTVAVLMVFNPVLMSQTISPTSITVNGGPVCSGGSANFPISITLPPSAIVDKVDVFFLFDDTGSFAGFVPTVTTIFSGLVSSLETALPAVSFGFGVGRLEDFGGPGNGFSGENTTGRPFTLNQPIVTAATAGSAAARNTLISNALSNTAPGFGGDGPESTIEALFQVGTGAGFDGDGNGSLLDSGAAGALTTQTSPGTSGDVPPFSSNVLPASGTLGGVGFRTGALHLVILATDISSVSPFPAGSAIPATITGAGGSSVPVTVFASATTTPGNNRFGFVSNSKTLVGNTVIGAVAPAGAGTVQGAINALNALGVRVLGMGPSAVPTTSVGPTFDESVLLSGLARLTGAVDASGNPLVFSTSVPLATLSAAIVAAITTTTTLPVDITLSTSTLPAGLSFAFTPATVPNVAPGGTASFTITLTGSGAPISGSFDINFVDAGSGAVLGSIPVTVNCADHTAPTCAITAVIPGPPKQVQLTGQDTGSGLQSIVVTAAQNATVTVPPFTTGATTPVVVTATKINQSLSSTVALTVTDVAGNSTNCDPVDVTIDRRSGKPIAYTFSGIPQAEHFVQIINDNPGLTNLSIRVNGRNFEAGGLKDNETRTIDVSSAMLPGNSNTIVLEGRGRPAGSATVLIHD